MTTTASASTTDRPQARPVKMVLTVLMCCVVIGLLIWQRRRLAGLPHALANANWAWIVLAAVCQVASIGALAREQRRLISVRGGFRPLPSVLATTWAGNAISISLPLVGSAAATVFVYRRFTAIGVDRAAAAWALAISGVYSAVTLAGIAAFGAIISGSPGLAVTGIVTVVAGVLPVCLVLIGIRRPRVHALAARAISFALRLSQRVVRRPAGNADEISTTLLEQLTSLRMGVGSGLLVASMALANWLLDLGSLICAILAIHATVPWPGVILAWAVGSGASSLNLTPGGLGVVEIALGASLVAAGLPAGPAIAAALLYRAVKLGLVLAVGGVTLLVIGRTEPQVVEPIL